MWREELCKQISLACVGSARSVSATLGLPHSRRVCFHGLPFSGSRLLCRELSEAGPGLCALPRSKPIRFRFSSTPQKWRLGWAWVLCPSQVQAAQVTRCLASAFTPRWGVRLLGFLGVQWACLLRCAACLFWGADCWLQPSQWMSTLQNPKNYWLAMEPVCSLVEDASLGLRLPLSGSGCLPPACLWWGMGQSTACQLSSGSCSVLYFLSRPGSASG